MTAPMSPGSKVYIAGVGYSTTPSERSSTTVITRSLVSAATKALLDAGVTYDDVIQGVTTTGSKTFGGYVGPFTAFGEDGVTVDEVDSGSELDRAFDKVKKHAGQCVLVMAIEQSAAVALVLISENFLWRHPYLKDSAVLVHETDAPSLKRRGASNETLHSVCQMVWILRGWSRSKDDTKQQSRLPYKHNFELSRIDAKPPPEWKEVEHKQDGKHRLRYNPATETRDISQEDFHAVRASHRRDKRPDEWLRFEDKGGDRAALAKL